MQSSSRDRRAPKRLLPTDLDAGDIEQLERRIQALEEENSYLQNQLDFVGTHREFLDDIIFFEKGPEGWRTMLYYSRIIAVFTTYC
jgi:hypothetical protein